MKSLMNRVAAISFAALMAYIYAFYGSEHNLQVGDLLKVSGTTTSRNGLIQFGSGCTFEKTGAATVNFPVPETMSVETIESYMSNPSIKYVTYSGTVLLSGNYTNISLQSIRTKRLPKRLPGSKV